MFGLGSEKLVKNVIDEIKTKGDKALCRYIYKFDKIRLNCKDFAVSKKDITQSLKKVKPSVLEALKYASKNILRFYKKEKSFFKLAWEMDSKGKRISQVVIPVESAGIYVPGGRFSYPSTVLMGVIPARAAGVGRVVVATPPGKITPELLAAACLAGADEVYRIGGPMAVAALAYGTKTIPKVNVIAGPGNIYVTAAKRMVFGDVGIDMLAGPSEIVIIADETAKTDFVAKDILAQCEHDIMARACLISWDKKKVFDVKKNIPKSLFPRVDFMVVRNFEEAADRANEIAPEHLGVICKNPGKILKLVRNAGAVFLGNYTPVALGDYVAGSSHVLPTGGSARFSSGLSTANFLKRMSIVEYNKDSCRKESLEAQKLAGIEGMKAHRESLEARIKS